MNDTITRFLIAHLNHCCTLHGLQKFHLCPEAHNNNNNNRFTALWIFFWHNPGELVPEETFTHSHLSWSSIIPYHFSSSITIHGILCVQFMCLTDLFHNLSLKFLGLAPSTSYSTHFFTQWLSSFRSTSLYHHNLFCCSTKIMSSNPRCSLNHLLGTLSCS